MHWEQNVTDVLDASKGKVTAVELTGTNSGKKQVVPADGLFIAIGHQPNTELFRGLLDMDEKGYIKTVPGKTATNIPGVFAAGDCQDSYYRQAVTAAGTGCMAAIEAERWLEEQHHR
jgi:thioredoxin reductase (NADPH)